MESKTYSVTGFYQVKNKLIVIVNKKCQEEVSGLGSFFCKGYGTGIPSHTYSMDLSKFSKSPSSMEDRHFL